jgi:Ran GTPase-activating protein (RanGAP) involved in mRNA processing and transport
MYHKLNNLMKKKAEKGDVLSKSHAKAKSGILQDLMDDMMGMEGDKVKGLKKVTVASNSPKGLEKGLEKAKEIVGDAPMAEDEEMPEGEEMAEGEEHEAEESPEMEVAEEEGEEKEVEDLKAEIEKLKEKLAKHNLA